MSSVACLSDGRFVCADGNKVYIMNEDGTEKEALLAGHSQVTLPQNNMALSLVNNSTIYISIPCDVLVIFLFICDDIGRYKCVFSF